LFPRVEETKILNEVLIFGTCTGKYKWFREETNFFFRTKNKIQSASKSTETDCSDATEHHNNDDDDDDERLLHSTMTRTDITKALQAVQDTVLPPLTHHATIDRPSLVILYSTAVLFAFSLSATHSVKYYFVIYLGGKLSDVVYTFMIFSFVGCLAPFIVASFAMTKLNPRYTYRPLFVMCSLIAIISVSNDSRSLVEGST
jgi:Na+/melibiose symporter-like transporter